MRISYCSADVCSSDLVALVTADPEMRIMVQLVEDYGDQIPEIVMQLKLKAVKTSADSRLILTSLHRSKGLEFDQVKIGDDSEICAPAEDWLGKRVIDQRSEEGRVGKGVGG